MIRCEQEMCRNWTGQGCACEFLDLEPDVVREEFWPSLDTGCTDDCPEDCMADHRGEQ